LFADDKKLVFELSNSKKRKKENSLINGGVGLENIRQRLALLYPNRHQLNISDQSDMYSLRLEINFRNEKV
ncbi:MAG: histidine kinase, partial [Bacteroidota bacterium]